MSKESCGNCRFLLGGSEPAGQCRRNPPVVLNEAGECPFPVCWEDQWCGEWRSKDATGASGKLYQLPNGDWIDKAIIAHVSAGGFHVFQQKCYVFLHNRDDSEAIDIDCPTKEAAEAMRDKIAADVNRMVGEAKK